MTYNNHIVCFHIGRGGSFNNPGHKTYVADIHCVQDCISLDGDVINEDEKGNPLPDSEWQYVDSGGEAVLQGRAAIEAETGIVDYDGEYDTYIIKELEDCDEEEIDLLYDAYKEGADFSLDAELCDYICEYKGLHRIRTINFDSTNADVLVSTDDPNCSNYIHFDWSGFDNEDDALDAWKEFFEDNDIDEVSQKKWFKRCKNHIYFD